MHAVVRREVYEALEAHEGIMNFSIRLSLPFQGLRGCNMA